MTSAPNHQPPSNGNNNKSMSRSYIYQIENLTKRHGQKEVLKDIFLAFYPGAKIGVLGSNGAGKSTLLRIMAGTDKNFDGTARLANGFTAGYLSQEPQLNPDKDVQGNVEEAVAPRRAVLDRFNEISNLLGEVTDDKKMEKLCDEMAKLQDIIDAQNLWDLDRQVEMSMAVMNLPPGDASVAKLSGGELRRVALCKLLIQQPDLLLLDEPTNHLDAEAVNWLEQHLAQYAGTVVAVTHDRYFLDNVAQWILELDRGSGYPFEGNYTSWLEQKQKRLVIEQKAAQARQKTLDKELEWIRMSPRARQAKNKARISSYEQLAAQQFEEQARRTGVPDSARQASRRSCRACRRGSRSRTTIESRSRTCRSDCQPVESSESSVPTVRARRRCSE